MTIHYGLICDRCNHPFRTTDPSQDICRLCFLGGLSPADRAAALLTPWRP